MKKAHRAKRRWHRPRNILLALVVLVLLALFWAFRETAQVYRGRPNIAVNYHERYRQLAAAQGECLLDVPRAHRGLEGRLIASTAAPNR